MKRSLLWWSCALLVACNGAPEAPVEYDAPFTSDVATLLDFEFDGELTSSQSSNLTGQIKAQLLYTVGSLNAEPGVARLDKLQLSQVASNASGGLTRVRYHARLPVAWGAKVNLPTAYTFVLPRRIDSTGQATFASRYGARCNDGEGADVLVSNFWYHYRPRGCAISPDDAVTSAVRVSVSSQNTVAKYPEYHKIWEDGALRVLAVFGKYEEGATSPNDAGISAYNAFLAALRDEFPSAVTTPANLPPDPGVRATDVTFEVTRPDGSLVSVVVLLVDKVATVGPAFDKRYAELTPGADLIAYNGHAGLGLNVRSLAQKGRFFPGKYQLFFMDGCDTFAYLDDALTATRAPLNPDDPSGTRYMDRISNAMPAYFVNMADASMALIRGLLNQAQPKSYGAMFKNIDPSQVAVVTGEEDNLFTPTYDPHTTWNGFAADGAVGKSQTIRYETEVLAPGTYAFAMTPDPAASSGDADLRIRAGAAPTITATYKCKSYLYNSNERCALTLAQPAKIYVAATGDSIALARFRIDGWQE
jgi:hypothetical protein